MPIIGHLRYIQQIVLPISPPFERCMLCESMHINNISVKSLREGNSCILRIVKARVPHNTSENKLQISPVYRDLKFGSDIISHKYKILKSFEGHLRVM